MVRFVYSLENTSERDPNPRISSSDERNACSIDDGTYRGKVIGVDVDAFGKTPSVRGAGYARRVVAEPEHLTLLERVDGTSRNRFGAESERW